jgi:phosphate transport system protein
MADHIVKSFDADLSQLKTMIAEMGGLAEDQTAKAMDSLMKRDATLATNVIQADEKLDTLELAIEEKAILTIARRQPMAADLREIMVAIRISADLERIGDLAKNIAKRTHAMTDTLPRSLATGLARMGRLAMQQLKDVLDAYAARDGAKAMAVWHADEEIDALFSSLYREHLTYMMEDPRTIGMCTHLLFASKNIERIGDHCTNIAENIYYLLNGKTIKDERPKKDTTSTTAFGADD